MGNLCCPEENDEELDEETSIREAIAELNTQLKRHERKNPIETDISVKWSRKYRKAIKSLELILNKVELDRTMRKVKQRVDIEYGLHECPKVEEMEGLNLPIVPNSLL